MKLRIVFAALFLALVAGGVWAVRHGELWQVRTAFSSTSEPTVPVSAATDRSSVTALGRLEPASRLIEVSGPRGMRVLLLQVDEGAIVSKGAVLAYLDDYPTRRAAKQHADVRLDEARSLFAAETENHQALIQVAELQLRQIKELTPLEINAQKAVVGRLEVESGKALRDLHRFEKLRKMSAVSDQELDNRQVAVQSLAQQLAEAKALLARIQSSMELNRLTTQAKINAAKATLKRAQLGVNVASLEAEVDLAEAQLERTIIRSPLEGTVLKLVTFPGEQIEERPILKMGQVSQMFAVAEVYETDVLAVSEGDTAVITSPALPQSIQGVVDRIGMIVDKNDVLDTDPAAPVDARVVEVRVRLHDSQVAARFNNLQVRVRIRIREP